jgi:hypothetical protein
MLLLTAGLLRAQGGQAGQAQIPRFEVTSVKPCESKNWRAVEARLQEGSLIIGTLSAVSGNIREVT